MPVWLGPSWMLRERCGPVRVMPLQSKHSLAAHGPGCIPWNSDLRQQLFQNLPVPKIGKKPKQCCSFRPVNVKMLLESVGEETAGRFWSLHVKVRNSFAHALLQQTAGSVGSGRTVPIFVDFVLRGPPSLRRQRHANGANGLSMQRFATPSHTPYSNTLPDQWGRVPTLPIFVDFALRNPLSLR